MFPLKCWDTEKNVYRTEAFHNSTVIYIKHRMGKTAKTVQTEIDILHDSPLGFLANYKYMYCILNVQFSSFNSLIEVFHHS